MSTRDKAVKLLIRKGANVNIQDDSGRTALSYACEMRCNDIVRILVKNNVDPDIADNAGNTPLIYSVMAGNDTAVDIIIRSFRRLGFNIDHVNNEGMTALLLAAKNGYIACASLLATEGKASLTFRDKENDRNAEEWARAYGCSTPEVIPFSANGQLYQNKLSKYLQFAAKQFESDEEETDDSDDNGEEGSEEYKIKDKQKKIIRDTQHNIPGAVMYMNKEDMAQFKAHQAFAAKKRGSLPAIKLSHENGSLSVRSETYLKKSASSMVSSVVSEIPIETTEILPSLPPLDQAGNTKQEKLQTNNQDIKPDTENEVKAETTVSLSPVMKLKTLKVEEDLVSKTEDVRVSTPSDSKYQPLPPIETSVNLTVAENSPKSADLNRLSFVSGHTVLSTSKVSFDMESMGSTQSVTKDRLETIS